MIKQFYSPAGASHTEVKNYYSRSSTDPLNSLTTVLYKPIIWKGYSTTKNRCCAPDPHDQVRTLTKNNVSNSLNSPPNRAVGGNKFSKNL